MFAGMEMNAVHIKEVKDATKTYPKARTDPRIGLTEKSRVPRARHAICDNPPEPLL